MTSLVDRVFPPGGDESEGIGAVSLLLELSRLPRPLTQSQHQEYEWLLGKELVAATVSHEDKQALCKELQQRLLEHQSQVLFALGKTDGVEGFDQLVQAICRIRGRLDRDGHYQALIAVENYADYPEYIDELSKVGPIRTLVTEGLASSDVDISEVARRLASQFGLG